MELPDVLLADIRGLLKKNNQFDSVKNAGIY